VALARKGFLPLDWFFADNYTLRRLFDGARTEKDEFIASWIDENETLPQVINHCMRYADLITRRHNTMVDRVRKAVSSKFAILAENEAMNGNMRPDLVIARNNTANIIDVTIPFENRMVALGQDRQDKLQKYDDRGRALRSRFSEVKVDAIVLGSLGTWDPLNDKVMKTMCSRKYLKLFKSFVCRTQSDIPETSTSSTLQESDNSEQVP
jgi:hypothetical protein